MTIKDDIWHKMMINDTKIGTNDPQMGKNDTQKDKMAPKMGKNSPQRSSISFNIENLSLIRDISLFNSTSLWKYWLKLGSRNNLYTKPDKINITPARNKDGIVIRCITQYRRSCKISINGRSPVEMASFLALKSHFSSHISIILSPTHDFFINSSHYYAFSS